MYKAYFGFKEPPFSIAPDPHYLYMTAQHREALAHLVYGLNSEGGCILLTGEVGTGKTTICRCLLEQVPEHSNIALLLNPKVTAIELLETICDEFKISYPNAENTIKTYIDLINTFLLQAYAKNEKTVLIIDEAQNLDDSVLEQLRLLTNLETNQRKLLQIVILGQPELLEMLSQEKMRQLAQRITARFHLKPLSRHELKAYICHRLAIAGQNVQLFPDDVIKQIYQISNGIPRLINVICDRALLGAYVQNKPSVDSSTLKQAAKEIFGEIKNQPHHYSKPKKSLPVFKAATVTAILLITSITAYHFSFNSTAPNTQTPFTPTLPVTSVDTRPITNISSTTSKLAVDTDTEVISASAKPISEALAITTVDDIKPNEDQLITTLFKGNDNKANAYRQLFELWHVKYNAVNNGSACSYAVKHGLSCLFRSGNLHSLRRLNRPAVIKIFQPNGENSYVTLTKLDKTNVTLSNGLTQITIEASTLDSHWLGEYTLLWQKPPYYVTEIKPGNKGPVVQWLDQQLVRIYGNRKSPTISNTYTQNLISQVKTFQQSKGLFPDGIAGPRTLIYINNALGLQAPQLLSEEKTKES